MWISLDKTNAKGCRGASANSHHISGRLQHWTPPNKAIQQKGRVYCKIERLEDEETRKLLEQEINNSVKTDKGNIKVTSKNATLTKMILKAAGSLKPKIQKGNGLTKTVKSDRGHGKSKNKSFQCANGKNHVREIYQDMRKTK